MILIPLFYFLVWTLLLGVSLIGFRVFYVLTGKKKSNEFPAWEKHGDDFYWRIHISHLNALENLPLFAVLASLCYLLEVQTLILLNVGYAIFFGRVFQTLSHLSGTGVWNVNFRFTGIVVQYAGFIYIAFQIYKSF